MIVIGDLFLSIYKVTLPCSSAGFKTVITALIIAKMCAIYFPTEY